MLQNVIHSFILFSNEGPKGLLQYYTVHTFIVAYTHHTYIHICIYTHIATQVLRTVFTV